MSFNNLLLQLGITDPYVAFKKDTRQILCYTE